MHTAGGTDQTWSSAESEQISPAAEVAESIDRILNEPVLVVGSLPPGGRDLDLLARSAEYETIRRWLQRAGFLPWRQTWARFGQPGLYAVQLASAQRWEPRRHGTCSLFADAEPIPGFCNLVRPAPASVLLLAAWGTVARRGRVTEKVRRRVSQALERGPDAWVRAERDARELGMEGALHLLRKAVQADGQLSAPVRAAGLAGMLFHRGPLVAKARVVAHGRPSRLRPVIVSFSGLDGSGKSTQVDRLRQSMYALGISSERQWAGFKGASKVRAALPILDRPATHTTGTPPRDRLVPTALRNSPVGRQVWVSVVAGVNAVYLWRLVLRRRRGTAVLIFDRFTPDSTVKFDLRFGHDRGIDSRWQRRIFTLVGPKPDVGFLVEVPTDVAYGRRQEQTPDELAAMAALYQEQVDRYRLRRLDGTQAVDVLAERVAVAAWRGLE